jgi:hypothetical protein
MVNYTQDNGKLEKGMGLVYGVLRMATAIWDNGKKES